MSNWIINALIAIAAIIMILYGIEVIFMWHRITRRERIGKLIRVVGWAIVLLSVVCLRYYAGACYTLVGGIIGGEIGRSIAYKALLDKRNSDAVEEFKRCKEKRST